MHKHRVGKEVIPEEVILICDKIVVCLSYSRRLEFRRLYKSRLLVFLALTIEDSGSLSYLAPQEGSKC